MKRIALALVMLAGAASAQTLVQANQDGGEIVLTNRPCFVQGKEYERLRASFAFGSDGKTVVIGCWKWVGTQVIAVWKTPGGAEWRVYQLASFEGRE